MSAVSKEFIRTVESACVDALVSKGFKKRAGRILTLDISSDVIGWVGLNTATRYGGGLMGVNPNVGVRHQGLQRLIAEIGHRKFHAYVPPTISTNVGYLASAQSKSIQFQFHEGQPVESRAAELASLIEELGLPFMRNHANLQAIVDSVSQYAIWEDATERLIAGHILLGRSLEEVEMFAEQRIAGRVAHSGNSPRIREFLTAALAH